MARGIGAILAGLGGGLTGYAQEQQRKREEQERARQREYAEALGLFQAGLEPAEQARGQASRVGSALQSVGQAVPTVPGMGGIGAALQAASQMPSQDIARGRSVTLGGREFVQPFSRTEEGIEERRLQARTKQEEQQFRRQTERDEAERKFEREQLQRRLAAEERVAQYRVQNAPSTTVRPPTEGQEKSFFYYDLMREANKELDALSNNPQIRPFAITAYLNTPGSQYARGLLNDEEKQFIRAAQDFAAGVYRKESGAAVNRSELAATFERYIEMGGEEAGSRQAKMDARNRMTQTMGTAALPALRYYGLSDDGQATEGLVSRTPSRPPLTSFLR
jgi:hypothetical protein